MVGLRDIYVVAPAASFHTAAVAAHHEQLLSNADAHSIIPLLTAAAAPYLVDDDPRSSQNPNPNFTASYLRKPSPESSGILFVAGGPSTCQDCGNQAKKDCNHRRCRTCCKSRGYSCSTHIKSTWVPAARRRAATAAAAVSLKKPRLLSSQITTASHASNSNSFDTGSSHQDPSFRESLPGQVRAPAVFKCVRVTSVDDREDEYAYHAKVNIGGHVFKGFLYNQGVDERFSAGIIPASSSTAVGAGTIPNFSELHLGGGVRNIPHADIYGLGGLLGGAAFGNAIN